MYEALVMKAATLLVYRADKNAVPLWRSEVIDNRSGASVCRTARVPSRNIAMLDGAANALDQGYLVTLGETPPEKNA